MRTDKSRSWLARIGLWLFAGNLLEGSAKALIWSAIWALLLTLSYRALSD